MGFYHVTGSGYRLLGILITGLLFFCVESAFCHEKFVHSEEMAARTAADGSVRVIVTFDVPNLKELQQAAAGYKVLSPGVSRSSASISAARQTDADLAGAIRTSAAAVFSGQGIGRQIHHVFRTVPQAVIQANHADLMALKSSFQVSRVVEDKPIPVPVSYQSNDLLSSSESGTYNTAIINADASWERGYDGRGWYVAVLDTGVRTSHEMFAGKTIKEACFSTVYDNFSTSLCPDGAAESEGPGSAVPPDQFGHGTHVSGIATGRQPIGALKGVAPAADLIAVQVFSFIPSWYDVGSFTSDQIKGLEYVYSLRTEYSIASVNMSLGDSRYEDHCDSDPREPAISNLRAAGIAVTVATGNEMYCGNISAPACVSSAIAVGASDYNDREYHSNNWHPDLQDIFAPGVSIYSAGASGDTSYTTKSGTSMAAPHVAGAWALFRQAAPTASVDEIEQVMKNKGVIINSNCSMDLTQGPRLDVDAVVTHFLAQSAAPTAHAGPDQTMDEGDTGTLDGTASEGYYGHGLHYAWTQTAGVEIALSDITAPAPTFSAPAVPLGGETLTFHLKVTDDANGLADTDTVNIVVKDKDHLNRPTAEAGPDVSADTGQTVLLDGSGSTSNSQTNAKLSYTWVQTSGADVVLSDNRAVTPYFVSPDVDSAGKLVFELIVEDRYNGLSDKDTVTVSVNPIENDVDAGFLPVADREGKILGISVSGGAGHLIAIHPIDPSAFENLEGQDHQPDITSYLFDVEIKCTPGATVEVAFKHLEGAPLFASWFALTPEGGWHEIAAGLYPDSNQATVQLVDGSAGDLDEAANGIIVASLAVGHVDHKSTSGTSGSGSGAGCMISSLLAH